MARCGDTVSTTNTVPIITRWVWASFKITRFGGWGCTPIYCGLKSGYPFSVGSQWFFYV